MLSLVVLFSLDEMILQLWFANLKNCVFFLNTKDHVLLKKTFEKIKRKAYPEFHCPAILTVHTLQGGQSAQITWLVRHEKT